MIIIILLLLLLLLSLIVSLHHNLLNPTNHAKNNINWVVPIIYYQVKLIIVSG